MSEKLLPEHIDPFRYAEQALQVSGKVRLIDMQRLQAMVNPNSSPAEVQLRFGIDEQGIPYVKGHLEARLGLQCQRCMDPYNYEIIADFLLGIVNTDEEANELPESYEPVLTKEGRKIALRELVEDELILNLPLIPKHDPKDCKVVTPIGLEQPVCAKDNPFKVLESLKEKRDK